MIIVIGSKDLIRKLREELSADWSEEILRFCCSVRAAAGYREGCKPPHVLILDETGLSLLENENCLSEVATICMAAGYFKYRPKGIDEPDNIMEVNSMNEAIRHALGQIQ